MPVHPGPWQQSFELHFAAGQNQLTQTYTVPDDRELEIETVTADIGITGGDQPFVFVTTTVRGVQCMHTIVLDQLPNAHDDFGATHDLRLYADQNTQVVITVTRFGPSGLPAIPKPELVVLSGRLL
jgi:hypothetical protein